MHSGCIVRVDGMFCACLLLQKMQILPSTPRRSSLPLWPPPTRSWSCASRTRALTHWTLAPASVSTALTLLQPPPSPPQPPHSASAPQMVGMAGTRREVLMQLLPAGRWWWPSLRPLSLLLLGLSTCLAQLQTPLINVTDLSRVFTYVPNMLSSAGTLDSLISFLS